MNRACTGLVVVDLGIKEPKENKREKITKKIEELVVDFSNTHWALNLDHVSKLSLNKKLRSNDTQVKD